MRQHGQFSTLGCILLGAMGEKYVPALDVIISCDNYHFLYDLGWELYGIAFLFFTALMLTCAAIILINMIMALERYCAGWRR